MTQHPPPPSSGPQASGQSSEASAFESTPQPQSVQSSPQTPPTPSGSLSTPPPPSEQSSATLPYARLILCLILIASFVGFLRNSDILQIIGLIATLMSINLLEPIYRFIDRLDGLFVKLENPVRAFFRRLNNLRGYLHYIINLLLVFSLIVLLFHTALGSFVQNTKDLFCLRLTFPSVPSAWCNSGLGVTTLPDGERIGLVGVTNQNDAPFDPSGGNSEEMQVEKLIFAEDASACSSTQPHITLAVATMLSRTVDDPVGSVSIGRDDLQGAYLAQHDYNALQLPIRLCLAIANLGTLTTSTQGGNGAPPMAVTQVMTQLVQYARYDSTFRGIIAFPYSSQVKYVLDNLASSWQETTLPIVSPESTSDDLSHTLYPNFHRISSPDAVQAGAMAQYVCKSLVSPTSSVKVAIFGDPTDIYSASLRSSFQQSLEKCLGSRVSYDPETYLSGNTQLIQKAVADAIQTKHDQFIFFPGHILEVDTLEEEIQRLQINSSSRVTILAGDGLYDITNPGYNFFAPVYTTVYASPLDMQDSQSQKVFTEYSNQFHLPYLYAAIQSYGSNYYLLSQDVLRTYEATQAFTQTLQTLVQNGQGTSIPSQAMFNQILSQISFTSFTNLITFQGNLTNDPVPAPVNIMCINSAHSVYWVATYSTQNGQMTARQNSACS